jgi:anti-sigma B factor antagonist
VFDAAEPTRVLVTDVNGVRIVTVIGELDVATRGPLEQQLAKVASDGVHSLIVDLRRVTFIDSGAIHALFKAGTSLDDSRAILLIEPGFVRRVLDIVEIERVFAIESSLTDAMNRVGAALP